MNVKLKDYKTMTINEKEFVLPKRIRQFVIINENIVVVRIGSKISDPEFNLKLKGGYIYIYGINGYIYNNLNITNIWRIDENTLGMYDGQADLWFDINKMEVVRTIWNPWGLDKPERY